MSIEDRDWIREPEERSFSFKGLPPILTIISVTVFAYIVQEAVANASIEGAVFIDDHLALSLRGFLAGEFWQPLTYLLLHGDFVHITMNMFGLWAFGTILRDVAGDRGIWIHYVAGGLLGAAACVLWEWAMPSSRGGVVVGASGAVTGVLVGAALRAPRTPIRIFLMPLSIPLWLVGALFVAGDLIAAFQSFGRGAGGLVAFQAHLGGAAAAGALFLLARGRTGGLPARPRSFRRAIVGDDEALAPPPPPRPEVAEDRRVEARVDALLAKIHAWGMNSLTEEERAFLKSASERYRGRRP